MGREERLYEIAFNVLYFCIFNLFDNEHVFYNQRKILIL